MMKSLLSTNRLIGRIQYAKFDVGPFALSGLIFEKYVSLVKDIGYH